MAQHVDTADVARGQGRREGLALAALALSMVSFVNLLGIEKSALAIVLAVLAMSGAGTSLARKRSLLAIGLAALHLVTFAVVIVVFREQLGEVLRLLHQLA